MTDEYPPTQPSKVEATQLVPASSYDTLSNPYQIPIPPPPPKEPKTVKLSTVIVIVSVLFVLLAGGSALLIVYANNGGFHQQKASTSETTPLTRNTLTAPTATPTPAGPLASPDFATFVTAFNNAIAAGDWSVIVAHTDTANFANEYSYTFANINRQDDWSTTLNELKHGSLTTKLDIPPDFVNSNASLGCEQYSANGVVGHQLNAHQVYYVYAWGSNNNLNVNPLRQIDEFEQATVNGSWQWVGIFSNLSVNSNNEILLDCEL